MPSPAAPLAAACLCLWATGCATLGEPVTSPGGVAELPQRWQAEGDVRTARPTQWLQDFDEPRLTELVDSALEANPDLQAAAARIEAAVARARIAGAARWPTVEAGLTATRGKRRITGSTVSTSRLTEAYDLGLDISWEPDVWGRIGHELRAELADAAATEADYAGARLSLAAEVSQSWFAAIEASQQVQLAEITLGNFSDSLEVIEDQYRGGLSTALDVRLARENVASARSNLAQRRRALDSALRRLETVLGRYPAARISLTARLPDLDMPIPAGLPSQLLVRRPDLVAAELRLQAAEQRVEAARRNRLPAFRLTGAGGTASDTVRDLLDWDTLVWNLLASVTQPVFEGGRLKAEQLLARAQHREQWAEYAGLVLVALREVETALAAESHYLAQEAALRTAAEEARESVQLAQERYRQGLVDIVTLLEAQRRQFNAESALLTTQRQRLDNRVQLYLALGGDFERNPAVSEAPTP